MFKQLEKIVTRKYARHIFALIMILTLLVGLYVMQTVFPFTIEELLNMPAVVFPPYFILGVVSVWLLYRTDSSKLIQYRWMLIILAVALAYGTQAYETVSVSIPFFTQSDVFACVLFFSGVALFSNLDMGGIISRGVIIICGFLLPIMFLRHSNLGVTFLYVILLVFFLLMNGNRLTAFFIATGPLSLLIFAIVSVPYRLHFVERTFWHTDPDSLHSLALKALMSGGLLGTAIPSPGLQRSNEICVDSSSASELIMCMSDDGSFIFSVIGEWYGMLALAAICAVFVIFSFFATAAIRRARSKRDAQLVLTFAGSVVILALLHILGNIGMFFWPLPLPFFNFSGPMVVIVCVAVGLIFKELITSNEFKY